MSANIFLEVGLNHLGSVDEASKLINLFIKSKFKYLTFMLHKRSFYNEQIEKKKIKINKNHLI